MAQTQEPSGEDTSGVSRRKVLKTSAGLAAATAASWLARNSEANAAAAGDIRPVVRHGHIRQSVVYWCFALTECNWDLQRLCLTVKALGCESLELAPPSTWPTLKEHGLACAIALNGMPGAPFVKGLNNPRYRAEVISTTRDTIEACAAHEVPSVIAFTGYKWRDAEDPESGSLTPEEGAEHCVEALKELARTAEKKGVTVCLEMLNTRDDTHPMKGHPGYQGDDLDYCADIVRRVGSPRVRLLFDVYHVQVMNGDVIRRLREHSELLGHIHTAGNPGRGALDENQEINYPAVMKALLDVGYKGYVGQEFIPAEAPAQELMAAVALCDVEQST